MTVTDETADYEGVTNPPQPAPRAPQPPPPPPGATPVAGADGTQQRPIKRVTVRRQPIARGTAAVGGTAAAGTLLMIVVTALGPFALAATAAGSVLVPWAIWRSRAASRTRRRSTARREKSRRERRERRARGRNGAGPGALGGLAGLLTGGGRRSTNRSVFGPGARAAKTPGTGRTRSAGLGAGGGKSRTTGGGSRGGGAGLGRGGKARTTKAGWPRLTTSKIGGKGKKMPNNKTRGGGGGTWTPNSRSRKPTTKTPPAATKRNPGGKHRPDQPATKPNPRVMPGTAKKPNGKKVNNPPSWTPYGRTRARRGLSRTNHGLWKLGSAFAAGVRKPTGKSAYAKAYRRYGKNGYKPTATGFAGRVAGGVAAAVPAWAARIAWMASKTAVRMMRRASKKVWKSLQAAYVPEPAATPTTTPAPAYIPPRNPAPKIPRQHPVPPPAFAPQPADTGPTPAPGVPRGKRPSPSPADRPATRTGAPMGTQTIFPPHGAAAEFLANCIRWEPTGVGPNNAGAVWELEAALPYIVGSVGMVANGWANLVNNLERRLEGGLKPPMRHGLVQVWEPLNNASLAAKELPVLFAKVYAEDIARRHMRGGATTNV